MTLRPKLIYLARRNLALSKDQFILRWRQHGALGMSMPRWKNIWRYVHCDVIEEPSAIEGAGHDGVGIVWHKSSETRRAHRADTSSQSGMEADEVQTFDQLVGSFCVLTEERQVIDAEMEAPIKLFRFMNRRVGDTREHFIETVSAEHASELMKLAALDGRLRRFVQNHAMTSETGRPWGLPYDYIEELSFDSLCDARLAEAALGQLHPAVCTPEPAIRVITNEVVLYDAPSG